MIRRQRGRALVHGRSSTYANYQCRCEPCREAHSAANYALRQKRYAWRVLIDDRLVAVTAGVEHGAASTYQNWGCRCEPCTEAQTAAGRARRKQET